MVKKKKLLKVKTKKEESGTASSASNQGSESDLAGAVGGMRIGDNQGEASSSSALSPEQALGGTRRLSAASSRSSLMSPTSATSDDSSSRSSAQSVLSPASTSSAYSHAGLRGVAGSVGAGSESDGAWGPVNSPLEGAISPDVSQKTAKIIAKENFLFRRRIFNETKEKQETTDPDYVAYVNHFEITINPKVKIYMYDVRMNIFRDDRTEGKECPSKFRRDALKEFLIQQSITKFPAYDGSHMLYCSAKLSENKTELSDVVHVEEILPGNLTKTIGIKVVVKECQKPSSVQIGDIIEYAKIPSIFNGKTYPQKPIQALEVILLSAGLERDNTFKVGRSIFKVPADRPEPQGLTGGAEHWSGLFQTIAVGEMPYNSIKSKCQPQFFLCLDAAHCAFRKPQPVTELKKITALQDFLRGAKIQYEVRTPNVSLTRLLNATGLGRAPNKTECVFT
ncbi:protein argonaute-2-like [Cloeon dipterum]|uniref:protein argonaute-2-like n=1 Tax=Cloeon dipterum TaxID=197152 RepID=UPI00322001F8